MLPNKNNTMSSFNMFYTPSFGIGRGWIFRFNTLYSLVMFLGIGICLWAAFWQYGKAQTFTTIPNQSVTLSGVFLNDHTRYLDNQTLNGQVGYAVITPFKVDEKVILVNRGFVALTTREALPSVKPVFGSQTIEGRSYPVVKPLVLPTDRQEMLKERIQYISLEAFNLDSEETVANDVIHMESGVGLLSEFSETSPYLSEHRHLAYAVQWILLAIAGLLIWLIASIKKSKEKDAV